jgi:hypothetical protein
MDSFGKIMEILVTVILLFLVPIYYLSLKQDDICRAEVQAETAYFVDSVRNQGYLTRNMYELFLRELDNTGQVYSVELTYYKKIEVQNEDGEYETHYESSSMEEFFTEELVRFQKGDFFKAEVSNASVPLSAKITDMVLAVDVSDRQIYTVYGGAIRDEIK